MADTCGDCAALWRAAKVEAAEDANACCPVGACDPLCRSCAARDRILEEATSPPPCDHAARDRVVEAAADWRDLIRTGAMLPHVEERLLRAVAALEGAEG